jgi:hypothetical protein
VTQSKLEIGSNAILTMNDWAGRVDVPVKVVGHTPKRVRVELQKDALLPSRRHGRAGDQVLVPSFAVSPSRSADLPMPSLADKLRTTLAIIAKATS